MRARNLFRLCRLVARFLVFATGLRALPLYRDAAARVDYSAATPGPGCDTNGGTWTPVGPISSISCGTTLTLSTGEALGYLYLQLPSGETFSPDNTIDISGNAFSGGNNSVCLGLAEQDANRGFLVQYCGSGNWFIYAISSAGAITKTLDSSITSTRNTETLSLALKGNTLTFTIDTEVHSFTVSPIQPLKVAIGVETRYDGDNLTLQNFSYTANS